MKNNLTPAKIVEMYLPDLDNKLVEFIKKFHGPKFGNPWLYFVNRYFSEALAERDRILCEKQKELCMDCIDKNFDPDRDGVGVIKNTIVMAPMPELKEK